MPKDRGEGNNNVAIGCTCENQERADFWLPFFGEAPIKHKPIICAPLLEGTDITPYLSNIEEVGDGVESGENARVCDIECEKDIRQQRVDFDVPFFFHQTSTILIVNGELFHIDRKYQH